MLQYIFTITIIILIYYIWFKKPFTYWKNKGVTQPTIWQMIKNFIAFVTKKKTMVEIIEDNYKRYSNKRYVGEYEVSKYNLSIHDPDLIKEITVKHFDHFVDHTNFIPDECEPLLKSNLVNLKGEKWRNMRSLLSPAFTSSKMRTMFVLIDKTAQQFAKHFLSQNEDIVSIEMKDTVTRYTNDVIANAAFGIQCDSLTEPENEFYLMGKNLTDLSTIEKQIKLVVYIVCPFLAKFFRLRIFPKKLTHFFTSIVKDNITSREKQKIVRPDMINLLLEARKNTDLGEYEKSEIDKKQIDIKTNISDEDITSQALIFFFAGFETVSVLMSFMALELAVNDDVQKKLQSEIDDVAKETKNQLTYEKLLGMKYMDMVVNETLRKWPNAIAIERQCTKNFIIEPTIAEEKPVEVEKGTSIAIPVWAIQRNEKYFPEPELFNPERFNDENKEKIHPYTYLPFGSGPRICIGSRFALMETKALFYYILLNFNIVPVAKTHVPIKLSKKALTLSVEGGFWLGLKRRDK